MNHRKNTFCFTIPFLAMAAVLACAGIAQAQSVSAQLSNDEAYVGMPVMLLISIEDASNPSQPTPPQVGGLRIDSQGTTRSSSQTIIINNRVTQHQSITYAFAVTPTREGTFTIPAFDVQVDGQTYRTQPLTLHASRSETGDLMNVQVVTQGPAGYVGQSIDVLLRINIKPFHDDQFNLTLSEDNMWNAINLQQSAWGIFRESLEDMYRQRRPLTSRTVTLENDQGERVRYYQYEIPAKLWPRRPGRLNVGDIMIVANYPTGFAQARGFFSRPGELTISGQRPITATPEVESVQIKPVPEKGRPDDFTGSVGKYRMRANAQPREVHAGDPIRLSLLVQGDGDLSFLHAPPLHKIPALTRNFHVPSEPIPGIVEDDYKLFSVNIRPKREDVTEIPAIPLQYFNPETEQFETAWSEPIPIDVKPMDRMSMDQIVSTYDASESADATQPSDPLPGSIYRADADDAGRLLRTASVMPAWVLWSGVALPPLLVLGWIGITQGRARFAGSHFAREREARRIARDAIKQADDPSQIIRALIGYIAHRAARPAAGMTPQEACRRLETLNIHPTAMEACHRCFDACEQQRYLGNDPQQRASLKTQAADCLEQLAQSSHQSERSVS